MLSHRDNLGFDYEHYALSIFESSGLTKYLIKRSPKDKADWKSQRGKGVDFIFKIGNRIIPVESKWHMSDYPERVRWFDDDVQSRFNNITNLDMFTPKIVCTNRPQNYTTSKAIQSKLAGFFIMNINQLVSYLKHLIVSIDSRLITNSKLLTTNLTNSCVTYTLNPIVNLLITALRGGCGPIQFNSLRSIHNT